jgi:hypothetical protein
MVGSIIWINERWRRRERWEDKPCEKAQDDDGVAHGRQNAQRPGIATHRLAIVSAGRYARGMATDYSHPGRGVAYAVRVQLADGRALLVHSDWFTEFWKEYWSLWPGIPSATTMTISRP